VPKQKKNSQPEDELYFDIVSPSAIKEEEEEKSSDQHVYQIPIRKEKFSNIDKKKNIIKEEVIDDDQEYEEVIEEVVVEDEPEVEYEKPTKAKSKKLGKKFS